VKNTSAVLGARLACPGVDRHPADRIAHDLSFCARRSCVMGMVVVRGHRRRLLFRWHAFRTSSHWKVKRYLRA
jgi:hypothetical protein